jgi:hypothetical protein
MKRVHELARELGVTSQQVLDAARRQGHVARSASSPLPDDVSAPIRTDLEASSAGHPADEAAVLMWLRQQEPDPEKAGDAAVLRFLADNRSITKRELRQGPRSPRSADAGRLPRPPAFRSPPWKPPPPSSRRSPTTTGSRPSGPRPASLAGELLRRWPWLSQEMARTQETAWVRGSRSADGLMGLDEVRTWWAAGLGPLDHAIAWACIRVGLRSTDLDRRLEGRRVVERLRGGESAEMVAVMLQEIA